MKITKQRLNRLTEKIKRIGYKEILITDEQFFRVARIVFEGLKNGYKTMPSEPEQREAYLTLLNAYAERGDEPAIAGEIKLYLKQYETNRAKN